MKYTILVIDDDKSVRRFVKEIFELEHAGYQVLTANNGKTGLEIAFREHIDLIILDWIMPVMGGEQTIQIIKNHEKLSQIPVVVVTSLNNFVRAFESGAIDFIRKPIDKTELVVRVKSTLSMFKLIHDITIQSEHLEIQSRELELQKAQLVKEQNQTNSLLLNILPYEIAEQLKNKGTVDAKNYRKVSIIFTDFVGFTRISEFLQPKEIIKELDLYFAKFDEIIGRHYIEKIKTIGDAYMCVGGLPLRNKSNPIDTILSALEMQAFIIEQNKIKSEKKQPIWDLRIGINTGRVVAGVVGKTKFAYDIWGDAVNTAARMESSGKPGKINISGATYAFVKDYFEFTSRGKVSAKNKGNIEMYFVNRLKPEYSKDSDGIYPNEVFLKILSEY